MLNPVIQIARVKATALCVALALVSANAPAQEGREFSNLQVLSKDSTRDDITHAMLENLRGLGLPRRQSQGCLFCHVGDAETPSSTWDYASDDKLEKRKAREMMAMTANINRRIAGLEARVAPDLEVTCYTCHAGRTDPRPLPELLMDSYEAGGVQELVNRYKELRDRYYRADAYDFRPAVLSALAIQLADAEEFGDALVVADTNAGFFPGESDIAETGHLVRLERVLAEAGIDAALAEFDRLRSTEDASWAVLDLFGWRRDRAGNPDRALAVFRRNLALFPDEYVPNESMGDALWFLEDDLKGAIEIFEQWLERHPEHVMAKRRVATLRAER